MVKASLLKICTKRNRRRINIKQIEIVEKQSVRERT